MKICKFHFEKVVVTVTTVTYKVGSLHATSDTGRMTLAAQAIPPIATHFSVAWSVSSVRLTHSCSLLKPFTETFGRYTCGVQ